MIDIDIMRRNKLYIHLLAVLLVSIIISPYNVYSDVFKIERMEGGWIEVSDTYLASEDSTGISSISLYADGYRMGSWVISFDVDLSVEDGGAIDSFLKISVEPLNISLIYQENYTNNGLFGPDSISNSLTLLYNGEVIFNRTSRADEPFNSRLNTRFYFVLIKVINSLYLVLRDEYGNTGSPASIYLEKEIGYKDEPLTLRIEAYKNSYSYRGSMKVAFLINLPKDSISYEKLEFPTLDYTPNAIFFLSMSFLIGAITFNVISTRFRVFSEGLESSKERREKKGRKARK